jgi:hypothetical protein
MTREPGTALVCMRQADLSTPPVKSRSDRCERCLKSVWVADSSPKADVIFCIHCALDTAEPGDRVGKLTERQIADIRKARAQ